MISPFCHFWSDGARFMLVPQVIRQYSKVSPRLVSSRRSASTTSALVVPGRRRGDHRLHRREHRFRRDLQLLQFVGRFLHALALEHEQRVDPVGVGKAGAQHDRGVIGQKAEFGGDALWS